MKSGHSFVYWGVARIREATQSSPKEYYNLHGRESCSRDLKVGARNWRVLARAS